MNLKELVDCGRYTKFMRMGEEKRTKHIEIANFIDQLSGASGINIDNWDVYEIFGKGVGNELILDKREINRRFFAKFREMQNSVEPERFTLEANVQAIINDSARRRLTNAISRLHDNKSDALRKANRHMNEANDYVADAFMYDQEARAMANRPVDVGSQIATIIAEGFWRYAGLRGSELTLKTRENVRCHHVNRNAGVDIQVNLGNYLVIVNLERMMLKARHVYGSSIRWQDYNLAPHPHVSRDGNICWGNSSDTVNHMLTSGELVEVLRLLANLLCDYHDENPYTPLASYKALVDSEAERIRSEQEAQMQAESAETLQEGETSPEERTETAEDDPVICDECEEVGHEYDDCPERYSDDEDEDDDY